MTLRIATTDLAQIISRAGRACNERATMPILSHLRLVANDGTLTVTGINLEQQIDASVSADGDLAITAPGRRLKDISATLARLYPDETADLSLYGERLTVKCRRHRYTMGTAVVEDFPDMELDPDAGVRLSVSAALLSERLRALLPTVAKQDVRYYLNGVLFDADPAGLRLVATDGHRLITDVLPDVQWPRATILPRESVEMLIGMMPDEGVVDVVVPKRVDSALQVRVQGIALTTKAIAGRYPDWRRVLPEDLIHAVTLPREPMIAALRSLVAVQDKARMGVRVTFSADGLLIEAANSAHDDGETSLPIDPPVATITEPVVTGFNAAYMSDALEAMPGESVTMHLTDGELSARIESDDAPARVAAVMPMRL